MRMRGLEPPRPERHTDLNRARLPIPPHPRADDSSRRHGYRHAARKPSSPIGVTPTMNRVLALLVAVGLCCRRCRLRRCRAEHRERAAERGDRHASRAPRWRAGPGAAGRAARARVDREQARFASALHDDDPRSQHPLALPHRAQRRCRRRPEPLRRPAADASGRCARRRERDATPSARVTASDVAKAAADVADGPPEPRCRNQDRDHRRRRRPDAPVLLARRLHDAGGLPQGADRRTRRPR